MNSETLGSQWDPDVDHALSLPRLATLYTRPLKCYRHRVDTVTLRAVTRGASCVTSWVSHILSSSGRASQPGTLRAWLERDHQMPTGYACGSLPISRLVRGSCSCLHGLALPPPAAALAPVVCITLAAFGCWVCQFGPSCCALYSPPWPSLPQ